MYQFILFTFCILCILHKINTEVRQVHEPINVKFNDLYSTCSQFGGSKLCLGTVTREKEDLKATKSDCVKFKNCVLLFQFEIVDSGKKFSFFFFI